MATTAAAAAFPIFSLPPEIRLYIWRFCLPGPRIIHLKTQYAVHRVQGRRTKKQECRATLPCPRIILTLLHLCHESRAVVESRYQALFASTMPRSKVILFHQHYFDPHQDGIFLDELVSCIPGQRTIWPWDTTISQPTGIENVKSLSINCNCWWSLWRCGVLFGQDGLPSLKNLEEIQIVFRIRTDEEDCNELNNDTDFSFPWCHVDIRLDPVVKAVAAAWKAYPDRKAPKVKLVGWVKR